jgi:Barstar (barnase inhibitor)
MKAPDLSIVDNAGVVSWTGSVDPLKAAATHAHLRHALVDLSKAKDRATLFAELDRALKLPEHFGHNWDALADVLEDRDWLGHRADARHRLPARASDRMDHPRGNPARGLRVLERAPRSVLGFRRINTKTYEKAQEGISRDDGAALSSRTS